MIVGLVPGIDCGSAHCASRRPSSRASSGKLVLSALGFRTHRFSARVARRGRSLERSKVRVLLVNSLVRAISRAVAPRAPSFCDASFVPSSRTTTERRPTVGASGEAWWRLKDGLRRRAARRAVAREEVEEGKPRREARPLPGRRRQGGRGGVPHAHACSPILLKLVLSHLAAGTGLAGANIRGARQSPAWRGFGCEGAGVAGAELYLSAGWQGRAQRPRPESRVAITRPISS